MGDRGEITFEFAPNRSVFLYSHWGGLGLPIRLQAALDSKPARRRWEDPSYLCRILISRIMTPEEHAGELSWGIAPFRCEREYPEITVDLAQCTVSIHGKSDYGDPIEGQTWSFAEYCKLKDEQIMDVYNPTICSECGKPFNPGDHPEAEVCAGCPTQVIISRARPEGS